MFKTRIIGIYQALSVFELLLSQAFYWLSLALFRKYYTGGFYFDLYAYQSCAYVLLISMAILFWKTDFQQVSLISPSFIHSYQWSAHRALVGLGSILLYLFVTKNETVSRAFMFTHFALQFLTIFVTHRYFPEFFATISFKGRRRQNALLIGPLKKAIRMKSWIQQKGMLGIEPVGVICKDAEEGVFSGLRIISIRQGIEKILKDYKIRQVILLELPDRKSELAGLFTLFEKHAVRLVIVNDLEETLGHSVVMIEDDGFQLIGMRSEPLENPFNRGLKRLLDITIALPVILLVLPPLMALVSWFQKRQSPGPLFISQARGGMQGQRFEMLKFRTMHTNQTITKQATKDDPRIYHAGAWFRKFSIDEIPQFWNVLKGEMSVVGPRPHLIEHDHAFTEITQNYLVRSYVKPGITGLSQVQGFRGATTKTTDLHDRVASDIYYIENWSLRMDLEIIFKTFGHMVVPPSSAV
jgi:exopolysaccharide biosynthesis polyprenyl glycosylphosphotransferase